MKQRGRGVIQLAVLVLLAASIVATTLLPRIVERYSARPVPLEISVVIRENDSRFRGNARLGMESAAGELGAELRFLTPRESDDLDAQSQLILREVQNGADALVIVPCDAQAVAELLRGVETPFVGVESAIEGAGAAVCPDNEAIGRALAEAALADGGGPVAVVRGGGENTGVAQRRAAAESLLSERGETVYTYTADGGSPQGDLETLFAQTDAAAVLTFEPRFTELAAAAKEAARSDVRLYGAGFTVELAALLEKGGVTALAVWSDFTAGYLAVENAVKLVKGEEAGAEPLPFFIIRGDEIYEERYQKLLFPVTN